MFGYLAFTLQNVTQSIMKYLWRSLIIALLSLGLSLLIHNSVTSQETIGDRMMKHTAPIEIVQLAQQNYQRGNFEQSIALWQQAIHLYQIREDTLSQAQVLAWVSLAQQKLGKWKKAKQTLESSQALLAKIPDSQLKQRVLAQIKNTAGYLALGIGKNNQALVFWGQAKQIYEQIGDHQEVKESLINQAQVAEEYGFYRCSCDLVLQALTGEENSCELLTEEQIFSLVSTITTKPNIWHIEVLSILGNKLMSIGQSKYAQEVLEASYSLTQQLDKTNNSNNLKSIASKILLDLGNLHRALAIQNWEQGNLISANLSAQQGIYFYQQLAQIKGTNKTLFLAQRQAQLNHLNLLIQTEQWSAAQQLVKHIESNYHQLTINPTLIYSQINFAYNLTLLKQQQIKIDYSWSDIVKIFKQALQSAHKIDDKKAEAYALGCLGQLDYEQKLVSTSKAQTELKQALKIAQTINAPEISYRWQWQLGRIYRDHGDLVKAEYSYQAAFTTLQDLRKNVVALDREIPFSFRQQVEPVYLEFAELLLVKSPSSSQANSESLQTARNVIEALHVAELENYFQASCLTFKPKDIGQIDPTAAVIYTIVFPQHLEVLLSLPNGTLHRHTNFVAQAEVEQTIEKLRQYLKEPDRLRDIQLLAHKIYGWLIEPFTKDLASQPQLKTLVFVLDCIWQNIPMAVLYDGENYLLEKYAIALTPSLGLIDPPQSSVKNTALGGGVSQTRTIEDRQFTSLKNVQIELSNIKSLLEGKTLLNDQFTQENLVNQLNDNPFSIVHLATHGQFSSDPNRTFILLWDRLVNIRDLNLILQHRNEARSDPLDLLVLSACETAIGDKRAALGLAGMVVRTGARSTLATLWQINDESTSTLMSRFYRYLESNKNYNKAEALRLAQLELWQNQRQDWQVPTFWAAYVLVGNWQ